MPAEHRLPAVRPDRCLYRAPEPADAPQLAALSALGFDPSWSAATFRQELDREMTRALVLEVEGEVVGYALGWRTLDELELHQISIAPAHRGRRLGEALLREFCAKLRGEGCQRLALEVRPSNQAALRLYQRCGLELEGRRKSYYPNGEDALLYGGNLE